MRVQDRPDKPAPPTTPETAAAAPVGADNALTAQDIERLAESEQLDPEILALISQC